VSGQASYDNLGDPERIELVGLTSACWEILCIVIAKGVRSGIEAKGAKNSDGNGQRAAT
jgi:hypothetical protein